jgi:hypothetical protein
MSGPVCRVRLRPWPRRRRAARWRDGGRRGAVAAGAAEGVQEAVQSATDQIGMVAVTVGFVDKRYTALIILCVVLMIAGAAYAL